MAANPIQNVNFLDPNSTNLAKALMQLQAQQKSAQDLQESGSEQDDPYAAIPGNSLAPAQVIKQSPINGLSKALEKGIGAYMERKSMGKQIDLQQAMAQSNYAALRGALGGGQSPTPQALGQALQPTSGAGGMPMPSPMGTPKGIQYGQMMQESGGNNSAVSPKGAAGVAQIMPATARDPGYGVQPLKNWDGKDPSTAPVPEQLRFMNDYRDHMPFDSIQEKLAAYNAGPGRMQQVENGTASMPAETAAYVPAVMQKAGMAAPQQQTQQPQGLLQGVDPDKMAYLQATQPELAKMYAEQNAYSPGQKEARDPLVLQRAIDQAGGVANAQEPATVRAEYAKHQMDQGQTPDEVGGEGGPLKTPAQMEGEKTDYTNFSGYKNSLNDRVDEGSKAMRIINAQEGLLNNFKSGTWTTDRAGAAAAAKALGAPDSMVNGIAGGDPAAVQAFEGLASQHALLQLKSLMQNGKVGQREFTSFKDDLASPDKQEGAIRAINNIQRQNYQADLDEQKALADYKGDPTKFRSDYEQKIGGDLVKPPAAPSQFKDGQTATNKQTGQKMIFKGGTWQPL